MEIAYRIPQKEEAEIFWELMNVLDYETEYMLFECKLLSLHFFCVLGNCCSVVRIRQEFRKKFFPKRVRWHTPFLLV